jgi:hypothetical protein
MVWNLSYQPKPDSFPSADLVEGERGKLVLEDRTPDGGINIAIMRNHSGRRVKPDSVPKVIRWNMKRKLLDFEDVFINTVSDRFRDLIEEIEPGIHQFVPVKFISKDGSDLAARWFWQICNRIDGVNREYTNWTLSNGAVWKPVQGQANKLVIDLDAIGTTKFWHDKHVSGATFVSDDAKQRIEGAAITGTRFHYYEQV